MSDRLPTCSHCEMAIDQTPHVRDDETGALFCGAMCHHLHYSIGGLLPLNHPEERSLERAQRWEEEHRAP